MTRPLIICDCDEVLLHMVVPFRAWLTAHHNIHFTFADGFEQALRHKDSGDPVERERLWELLDAFFTEEMRSQTPIPGAVAAMTRLAARADIAVLTNIGEAHAPARTTQLHAAGLPFAVVGNRGGKGPAVARLLAEHQPDIAVFIDDLASNHSSVAQDAPQVWRLHFVGEPEMAPHVPTAPDAHLRLDAWPDAARWIAALLDEADEVNAAMQSGETPPALADGSSRRHRS